MGDAEQSTMPSDALEPIAICGMAMRLPGVRNSEEFWKALIDKRDLKSVVPEDRFNVDAFYSPDGKPGTIISREAFYLSDAELGHLDTSMFNIATHELRHIDPQQRMLLELTRECLENAGETDWRGKRVGCYVGTFGEDWLDLGAKDTLDPSMYRAAGTSDFALSNRISYEYDFRGPSMTIKTGCSAAMMGLNEACWAINAGQCDSAIVAGSNLIMTPTMTISMGAAALSPTGTCKTFDADADGYARGEAVNIIFVKRLSEAVTDGNAIRAVIRGIGVNSDGQTSRTFTPSLVCQESLIRETYAKAGLPFDKTAFFECHGTGTRVGDPIEAGAVDKIFGDFGIHIGAVKPNFGHSEGASAITSIIKAILALERRTIPPNMRFTTPNPAINWGSGRLIVPTEKTPWPNDRDERVSVNSFGIGGANGHVILDSPRSWTPDRCPGMKQPTAACANLIALSATHEKTLAKLKASYETLVATDSVELGDLAYTLGAHREHHQCRTYCVASPEKKELSFSPTARVQKSARVVFVFNGQGGTWAKMGRKLLNENEVFRKTLKRLDGTLGLLQECSFSLKEELLKNEKGAGIQEAEISQPLSTAIQICLCNALRAAGLEPYAVLGHSSGEIAAAYVAGALTEEQAITASFFRGQAIKSDTNPGAMTSVGLGRDVIEKVPLHGATLACDNSPSSVTLSGQQSQIEAAEESVESRYPDCLVRRLQVNKAYHSNYMHSAGELYEQLLASRICPGQTSIPYYSALTGRRLNDAERLDSKYWRRHLESPVMFRTAVEQIVSDMEKDIIFAEIGPHPTLTSSLIQTCSRLKAQGISHVSFMRRSGNSAETFLEGLGRLYQLGVPIDFHNLTPHGKTLTDLPNYPWLHEKKQWNETRLSREWRFRKYPRHDLLGVRTGDSSSLEPSWRNMLRLDDVGWIKHHQVGPDVVLPFTAYCTMAGEAVQQVHEQRAGFSLRRVRVGSTLTLGPSDTVEIITTLRPARLNDLLDSSWFEFSISSHDGSQWIKHCSGSVRLGRDPTAQTESKVSTSGLPRKIDTNAWYKSLANVGLNYGAEFRRLRSISSDIGNFHAAASIEDERSPLDSTYELHPATLDSAVQLIGVAASRGLSRNVQNLFVPVSVEEMYVEHAAGSIIVGAMADVAARGTITGKIHGLSGTKTVLHIKGLTLYPLDGMESDDRVDPHAAAVLEWIPDLDLCDLSKVLGRPNAPQRDSSMAVADIISLISHANPLGSVLSIGPEEWSMTDRILEVLIPSPVEKFCSTFTLGNPSDHGLEASKEKFGDVEKMKHVRLDLSHDMASQECPAGSYDLVVVNADLLETCPNPTQALTNLRQLIPQGGKLLVYGKPGPTYDSPSTKYDEQCTSDRLLQAGFSDVEVLGQTIFVARAPSPQRDDVHSKIRLLCITTDDEAVHAVVSLFSRHGTSANVCTIDDFVHEPNSGQILVSVIDLQGKPALLDPSSRTFNNLMAIIQNQQGGIVWLTKPGPEHAMILGLARTARTEFQSQFYTLELSDINATGAMDAIWKVFSRVSQIEQEIFQGDREGSQGALNPDFEYALYDGVVHIPRFRWKSLRNDLLSKRSQSKQDGQTAPPVRLQIGTVSRLDTLHWQIRDLVPMQPDYIDVEVKATGVNFKDVLVSLGIVESADNALGIEGAGIVSRVGEAIDNLEPGDRVMFCGTGAFANAIRGAECCCVKIPDNVSFKEAATMPCVFLTAMYALLDLGRLEKGESVLIHSGCGGVGLAAIQLAQMIGAEIFVTVGDEKKVQHLVENYGIPRNHIFTSRSAAFYPELMRQTAGRGVDVVLNSLSGELLHASWRCVAKFGRMVEIGKRDLLAFGKLDMDPFEANRSYSGFSLEELLRERPNVIRRLFSKLVDLLRDGSLKPISPINTFPATAVEECFRYMQKGQHIGKIVVEIPEDIGELGVRDQPKEIRFDQSTSYLLVGGLGGLGRAVARWMVENGAVHLIFLSRTAGTTDEHAVFLDELRAMGAICTTVAGDVTSEAVVRETVRQAVPPIKGVVQASMVLKDVSLPNMTHDDWTTAIEPKVKGAWNLHNAFEGINLDFFVILGSLSGIVGQHGQANYNAANAFLNAFVSYRHSLSLAASILNLSAVGDVGTLSQQTGLLSRMKEAGAHLLRESDVLEAFHWAVENSKLWETQPADRSSISSERGIISLGLRSSIPLQSLDDQHPWKRDRRMAMYHNSPWATASPIAPKANTSESTSSRLLQTMERIHADPKKELSDPKTAQVLAEEIGKKAFSMLLKPDEEVDIKMALLAVGLDSLMAMQLRQWWRDVFRVEVNVLQVANAKTFEGLGLLAVSALKKKLLQGEAAST